MATKNEATTNANPLLADAELEHLRALTADGQRPRLVTRLQAYDRHVSRIRSLKRVLDPNDTDAIGNSTSGNEESYRAEIARRSAELARMVPQMRQTLKSAPRAGANNG